MNNVRNEARRAASYWEKKYEQTGNRLDLDTAKMYKAKLPGRKLL